MYDKKVFYDSDCLICFLIVNQCGILQQLFSKVIVSTVVQKEILNLRLNPKIQQNFNKLVQMDFVEVRPMELHSTEHSLYLELKEKYKFMGNGEAAVIALAFVNKWVVASNNLLDVRGIVEDYDLNFVTTAFILAKAYEKGIKTRQELDEIWKSMLENGRKRSLPNVKSFTDYYENKYVEDSFYMGLD